MYRSRWRRRRRRRRSSWRRRRWWNLLLRAELRHLEIGGNFILGDRLDGIPRLYRAAREHLDNLGAAVIIPDLHDLHEGDVLSRAGDREELAWLDAGLAAAIAFLTALPAIAILMLMLKRISFTPFVVYRLFLGVVLLVLYYGFGWTLGG